MMYAWSSRIERYLSSRVYVSLLKRRRGVTISGRLIVAGIPILVLARGPRL